MSDMARAAENYWRDEKHILRVTFIGPNGQVIREMGEHQFPAPLNRDAAAPVSLRVELLHDDGCSRVLQIDPLRCYD